jgi:hypothetical protein
MPSINATFKNAYGESRAWDIQDIGIDPNLPKPVFSGYLDADASTDPIALHSGDGVYATALYKRSDGAANVVDNITDGTEVRME